MDLLSETSGGPRILTARHISADKSLPATNNAINATLLCHNYHLNPDFGTYLSALNIYAWVIWSFGLLVLLAILAMYVVTIRSALKHWKEYITHVAVVTSIYPIVALTAFISIVVPRARMPAEAIAQEAVMIAMYHFFCLILAECGGTEQFVRSAGGASLNTRVMPCCCWPCCVLPRPKIQEKTFIWLRFLVLQIPIVQAIIYTILIVLWSEDFALYNKNLVYFQPFVALSILSGMWGVVMCVKAAMSIGYFVRPRFFAIQLVLIIVKLQCGIAKSVPDFAKLPCIMPLNPAIVTNIIQSSIMMVEMLIISFWAWRLYSMPPGKDVEKMRQDKVAVAVSNLDDSVKSIEVRSVKDGIDNKSFTHNIHVDD